MTMHRDVFDEIIEPAAAAVFEEVKEPIARSLAPYVVVRDVELRTAISTGRRADGEEYVTVRWVVHAAHVFEPRPGEAPQDYDVRKKGEGRRRTGRDVEIEGLSLLRRDARGEIDVLHHVDWAGIMVQLGQLPGRPVG
jgi:hypothetical protein